MATQQEKNAVLELVNLAMEINSAGKVSVDVDVTSVEVRMRVSKVPYVKDQGWLYYGESAAYFASKSFSEDRFLNTVSAFIAEAQKYHPQFDADGVKL